MIDLKCYVKHAIIFANMQMAICNKDEWGMHMSEIKSKIPGLIEKILFPVLYYRSQKKDYNNPKNVNKTICSKCGGECCKRCGCYFSPDDFKEISFEALKTEIERGYISIVIVWGKMALRDLDVYILRVRNQGAPIVDTELKRTPCIFLTETGCKLTYEQRPSGGKLLIPSERTSHVSGKTERNCHSAYDIELCCYEWEPYQNILHQLAEYFQDKEIPCSI